jgi:hypothetical protein
VKTYALAPEDDPDTLPETPFEQEGFRYTFISITKDEKPFADKKPHSETVTVNTESKDLAVILEALSPTLAYENDGYSGVLTLDHASLKTEAAGYTSKSYTVSETKTFDNLDRNDPAYIPKTTVKNGQTLTLSDVSWSTVGSSLSDDALVPTMFSATATYSGSASSRVADGYVTTAAYSGEIEKNGVAAIVYTVTYLGAPIPAPEPEFLPEPDAAPNGIPAWAFYTAIGVGALSLAAAAAAWFSRIRHKRLYDALWEEYLSERTENYEAEEHK